MQGPARNDDLDFLVLAAHPDDAELGCGGTLHELARAGRRVGVLDLTRGELGSRGTAERREKEAAEAASILGLACRRNAGIPDGGIDPHDEGQRRAVIEVLRELRPRVLALPWREVRHPDHAHASRLGEEAVFRSGLHKLETGAPAFRPGLVLYYMERVPFEPTLVVDVSESHATKLEAVRAYRSQFERRDGDLEPATFLTDPGFLEGVEAKARWYGSLAGCRYGEPYRALGPIRVARADFLFSFGEG